MCGGPESHTSSGSPGGQQSYCQYIFFQLFLHAFTVFPVLEKVHLLLNVEILPLQVKVKKNVLE